MRSHLKINCNASYIKTCPGLLVSYRTEHAYNSYILLKRSSQLKFSTQLGSNQYLAMKDQVTSHFSNGENRFSFYLKTNKTPLKDYLCWHKIFVYFFTGQVHSRTRRKKILAKVIFQQIILALDSVNRFYRKIIKRTLIDAIEKYIAIASSRALKN